MIKTEDYCIPSTVVERVTSPVIAFRGGKALAGKLLKRLFLLALLPSLIISCSWQLAGGDKFDGEPLVVHFKVAEDTLGSKDLVRQFQRLCKRRGVTCLEPDAETGNFLHKNNGQGYWQLDLLSYRLDEHIASLRPNNIRRQIQIEGRIKYSLTKIDAQEDSQSNQSFRVSERGYYYLNQYNPFASRSQREASVEYIEEQLSLRMLNKLRSLTKAEAET